MDNQKNAPLVFTQPLSIVIPRALTTKTAAQYIGMGAETLRKMRYEDQKRIENGEERQSPKWIKLDRKVLYLREELDAYLDKLKSDHDKR